LYTTKYEFAEYTKHPNNVLVKIKFKQLLRQSSRNLHKDPELANYFYINHI